MISKEIETVMEDAKDAVESAKEAFIMPEVKIEIPGTPVKKGRPKKVETVDAIPAKVNKRASFIPIEVVSSVTRDPFRIYDENPNYIYRWCLKTKMANSRRGIWHTVPREHSDFEGLRVEIDHTPDQSFFSFGDLILCCARKETVESRRNSLLQRNLKRGEVFEKRVNEKLAKLDKDVKSGITQKMVDDLDTAII